MVLRLMPTYHYSGVRRHVPKTFQSQLSGRRHAYVRYGLLFSIGMLLLMSVLNFCLIALMLSQFLTTSVVLPNMDSII